MPNKNACVCAVTRKEKVTRKGYKNACVCACVLGAIYTRSGKTRKEIFLYVVIFYDDGIIHMSLSFNTSKIGNI